MPISKHIQPFFHHKPETCGISSHSGGATIDEAGHLLDSVPPYLCCHSRSIFRDESSSTILLPTPWSSGFSANSLYTTIYHTRGLWPLLFFLCDLHAFLCDVHQLIDLHSEWQVLCHLLCDSLELLYLDSKSECIGGGGIFLIHYLNNLLCSGSKFKYVQQTSLLDILVSMALHIPRLRDSEIIIISYFGPERPCFRMVVSLCKFLYVNYQEPIKTTLLYIMNECFSD